MPFSMLMVRDAAPSVGNIMMLIWPLIILGEKREEGKRIRLG